MNGLRLINALLGLPIYERGPRLNNSLTADRLLVASQATLLNEYRRQIQEVIDDLGLPDISVRNSEIVEDLDRIDEILSASLRLCKDASTSGPLSAFMQPGSPEQQAELEYEAWAAANPNKLPKPNPVVVTNMDWKTKTIKLSTKKEN
jgi:hypothetical protein